MSITTITPQQRYDLGQALSIANNHTQRFISDTKPITAAQAAPIEPTLTEASTQLAIAGYGPELPPNQVNVTDGDTISVTNSEAADAHPGTAAVADGVLTIQLEADTATIVDDTDGATIYDFTGTNALTTSTTAWVDEGVFKGLKLPATAGIVRNGTANVSLARAGTSTGIGSGSAVVTSSVLNRVVLPSTIAATLTNDTIVVQNSAGATPHNGTATVSSGTISNVKLAATAALVDNNQALTVPVTGTYTNTATLTVANGVVTGIVLS